MSPSPYTGARIAYGTMHGKEATARAPFQERLGAHVVAPDGIDTDRFGTFTGTVPRRLAPVDAAAAKAALAMELTGEPFALASEATYLADFGPFADHHELLLFQDGVRGMMVVESAMTRVASPFSDVHSVSEGLAAAARLRAPDAAVTISTRTDGAAEHRGGLRDRAAIVDVLEELLRRGGTARIQRDRRAFADPDRRAVLAALADRMADRLTRPCPACGAPGWGVVDVERGLPRADCGSPTRGVRADVLGCACCGERASRPRGALRMSADRCDVCNP